MFASSVLWQLSLTSVGRLIHKDLLTRTAASVALFVLHTFNSELVTLPSVTMSACPFGVGTAMVYDKTEHYYAIGNTPPQQLIPSNIQNPQILCLAAGDLRTCLFSISRASKESLKNVTFVINDKNPAILARNVVHLALSLRPQHFGCSSLDLWTIWYSLFVSKSQWDCVYRVLCYLLKDDAFLQDLKLSIPSSTLQKCRQVWEMWLGMDLTIGEAKTMHDGYMSSYLHSSGDALKPRLRDLMNTHFVRQGYIGGAFVFQDTRICLPGLHQNETELRRLVSTFDADSRITCSNIEGDPVVNNTLFMNPDRYNLHYGSAFYESFHLWHFKPNEETLEEYCRRQHAEWVNDLQVWSHKINFEFVCGDCNVTCLSNPGWCRRFDVIDTSNVCDHVGLVGLLLTCRPLITPDGVMFTTSITSHSLEGDVAYLRKELVVDESLWQDMYGWCCHHHESNVESLNIEWPLVSPNAPFRVQWRPAISDDVSETDVLIVLKRLLNPYYAGPFSFYSTGIGVLLLMRNTLSPIDFLTKIQSEIPETSVAELELWISQNTKTKKASKLVDVELLGNNAIFAQEHVKQPWLRAQGRINGRIEHFSILRLETSSTGKTYKLQFLAPVELEVSSVQLYNFNTTKYIFDCDAVVVTPFVSEDSLVITSTLLGRAKEFSFAQKASSSMCHFSIKGLSDWTQMNQAVQFPFQEQSVLRLVSSQMMMKSEMLFSRSAPFGGVSDEIPLLSIKELLLSLVGNEQSRNIVCVGDGAGTVPLVIVKDGIFQHETLGVPVLDLVVFVPKKSFSSHNLPRELEHHHSECVLSWNTRKYFRNIVETLTGDFDQRTKFWGAEGASCRLLFPALFPKRCEKMAEVQYQMNVSAKLGILDSWNDCTVDVMMALKENGNSLLREQRFGEAMFSYTLAALKIENEGVDDTDPNIRELAAQCHCNIALVKLNVATSDALLEGVRSTSFAIHLAPTWGKPYYRRGQCYEKQGLTNLAIQDFKKAKCLCPKDPVITRALSRVQRSTDKV